MNAKERLRWALLTLLVIAAVGVMLRLGFWQLDRLAQRRSFNQQVQTNQSLPVLDLNANPNEPGIENMRFRQATARGEYIPTEQVMLRNQFESGRPGVNLITPLKVEGSSQVVLVDRGWIPLEDAAPEKLGKYDEPGVIEVRGVLQSSRTGLRPRPADIVGNKLIAVNVVDIQALAGQVGLPLEPVYLQAAPGNDPTGYPIRSLPEVELTEGPHASYALQWFTFAVILAAGYPYYVYTRFRRSSSERKPPLLALLNSKIGLPHRPHIGGK